MFGLFEKRAEFNKLQRNYEQLIKQLRENSIESKSERDAIYNKAQEIITKMESL